MENTNEMTIVFDSRPVNEGMARIAAASFCTQLNPTLEEVADLKTAVSEAVTNCIIHGYEGEVHKIRMDLKLKGREIFVDITDQGVGISDVKKAMDVKVIDIHEVSVLADYFVIASGSNQNQVQAMVDNVEEI